MIKNFILTSCLVLASSSLIAGQKFGEAVKAEETIKIEKLMTDAETLKGKSVTVEGMVTEVCAKRGCWMTLQTGSQYKNVRIKVEDGVMVFPMSARGKKAIVKGTLEVNQLSQEKTVEFMKHIAEENKKTFDPKSVKEPMTVYQINAKGAEIL